jgi:predicted nucleic acid-binding protein
VSTPANAPAPVEVVTDANVWLHAALPMHPYHAQALRLITDCVTARIKLLAPPLWESETDSGIRRALALHHITPKAAQAAFKWIDAAPVGVLYNPAARTAARSIADAIKQPRVYDATYLALAQLRACEIWTADERLFNAANTAGLSLVRFVATYGGELKIELSE